MLTPSQLITMTVANSSVIAPNKKLISATFILSSRCRMVCALLISGTVMAGLTGCGQKGDLYLADTNSTNSQMVSSSSDELDSTSHPQDAAFAGVDDVDYQKNRYLEQKQLLPDVTDDPNDY